ncbi:flagella basal body P-ring formation protein FlgA [Alginatibacterium sediminis]|uniref:Flagella basal body P-ring formation protein FlgA n=1 Tax=Alginatibacterium sediminis TaxID=2164068 RepID=A0A420EFY4_9ALTE|nr:flagellar basal body P-ring formation chaperone FlgA [Alginatibacterium sediminis]RKF19619.1 flagella basal body P-ring formation protein FlgA [Alginatibacterium sediminis]
MKMFKFILMISLAFLPNFASFAATTQQQLQDQAEQLVLSQLESGADTRIEIDVAEIDKRTHIIECSSNFNLRLTQTKIRRSNSVLVTCADDINWRVYIPVRVSILKPAIVVREHIAEGQLLSSSNIKREYLAESKVRGDYYQDIEGLEGARVKRKLRPGQLIKSRDLCIVCEGDPITIEVVGTGLSISTDGTALNDGTIGDRIRVINNKSQRKINAFVVASGLVKIHLQ